MKILLAIALSLSFITTAYASKARVGALQTARFLVDSQTIFTNPAHVNSLGQHFTAEFGGTTNTASPKAEGGLFVNKMGGTFGVYLGHMNTIQSRLRNPEGYYLENNPVELIYGTGNFGASIYYARDNKQTTAQKQQTFGLRAGYDAGNLEVFTTIDLFATSFKSATADYKRKLPTFNLGAEYDFNKIYIFSDVTWAKSKQDIAAPAKNDAPYDSFTAELGAQDRTLSSGPRMFYYGLSVRYDTLTKDKKKNESFTIPVVFGIEQDLNDWSVLRASLTQNFLIGHTKDATATAPNNKKDTIANNTTVAAGAGVKYKGFTLDGLLAAASTGVLNANSVLTQASLTYNF
ncbi:MAG: hypothetical protein M9962_04525 [Oligoflexia bacterium]|nr:hypothetical protein [Oligoflexia bacterium]